jgi:hypothetical protein
MIETHYGIYPLIPIPIYCLIYFFDYLSLIILDEYTNINCLQSDRYRRQEDRDALGYRFE